jgi:molybdenum cofactor synthesis domain-containing protein
MPAGPTAAVIIIGNEILSGRTQDNNLSFLGRQLDELGICLAEARVIPDQEEIIISTVNACRRLHDYVFTTGGIGPTHDDITSASVARAFGVSIERNEEAVACLDRYYEPGVINEARLKMADIPAGAILIQNPISGAPGFQLENVFVLPGVPMILQAMFEGITDRLTGGATILTAGVSTDLGEGTLAKDLGELQHKYPDVTIGSYPYFKKGRLGVNIVMRATDAGRLDTLKGDVKAMITRLKGEIIDG